MFWRWSSFGENIHKVVETIWLIKRCNHGFSSDEEFTAPSPTKCEDVLSYVKDLPIRAEVCVPPANAGKFVVFLLKKKKYLFWRRRSIRSEEREVFVLDCCDRYKAVPDVNGRDVQRHCGLAAEQKISEYGSRDLAEVLMLSLSSVRLLMVISEITTIHCHH